MMNLFSRYVLRSFLWIFFTLLFGFVSLFQLFDVLSNGADILENHAGRVGALFEYSALRIPEITSFLIPFAVLLGTLMTLGKFERNNEIMAYKAAGASYFSVLSAFLPAVGLVAALHFILADRVVPLAIGELNRRDLAIEKSKERKAQETEPAFVQDGSTIIEAEFISRDGQSLEQVRIYDRDRDGKVITLLYAENATFDSARHLWRLRDVWKSAIIPGQPAASSFIDAMDWTSQLTPIEFSDLVDMPQAMTITKLWNFVKADTVGVRPTYFYETWINKRIALPASSILMILLAAPVAHSLHRRERGLAIGVAIGFGLGFLYFLTDGLVLSLGESGAIPPFFSAWLPILLFSAIGGIWLIRQEGY
jgi:lipopolysaccharide export system permease protein